MGSERTGGQAMYDDLNGQYDDAPGTPREAHVDALMQDGQYTAALTVLEDWYAQEPWNGDVLVRMAVVHWLTGEPARTLRDLDAFLAMDPDNAEVLARRAQALLTLGKRADAEVTLAHAEALDPTTPGVLLNKALLLEDHGDYPAAVASLSAYLQIIPDDHMALARRSSLHRMRGEYQASLEDALACVRAQPEDPESHFAEALAWVTLENGLKALAACDACLRLRAQFLPALRLQVDLLADLGRIDEAEVALARLVIADPAGSHTALLQARLATERGQFSAALDWVHRFLDDNPDEPYGYFRRGVIYERMEQYEAALADFQQYAALAPHALEAYEQQFLCYLGLERYAEAAEVSRTALSLSPQHYRLTYNAGFAALLCGDIVAAKEHFLTTLQLAPAQDEVLLRMHLVMTEYAGATETRAWLVDTLRVVKSPTPLVRGLLAEGMLDSGEWEEALRLARDVMTTDPTRLFGYLLGIKTLCLRERYDEALSIADAGIRALPHEGQLRLGRALVLRDMGRQPEALAELDIATTLMPGDADVLCQQALVFGSLGDTAQAVTVLTQAIRLEHPGADCYFWLAYFLLHQQQYAEALVAAEQVMTMEPDTQEGRLVRGAALNALERREEGRADIAQVMRDDPGLVTRISADPVMAALLAPQRRAGILDRVRRSFSRWRSSSERRL